MSAIFRDARPDLEEGLVCARYINEAAEGFIRFMFGGGYAEIIAKAYTQPDNQYSFQNVIFAERDSVIVGMALGFTALQRVNFSDEPIKRAAEPQAFRMRVVKTLFAPMMRIIETIDPGDYYILTLAVDTGVRGEGIGTMLLDAMEERAVAGGSARLALDVAASNGGARRLYERRGMNVESQWPKRLPLPGIRFYRMTKSL